MHGRQHVLGRSRSNNVGVGAKNKKGHISQSACTADRPNPSRATGKGLSTRSAVTLLDLHKHMIERKIYGCGVSIWTDRGRGKAAEMDEGWKEDGWPEMGVRALSWVRATGRGHWPLDTTVFGERELRSVDGRAEMWPLHRCVYCAIHNIRLCKL